MTKYLDVTESAKLLRQALRESFPGVKFSVRCSKYSGGSSMNVGWTDGPTEKQVKAVADTFEGAYFDGMIDYKGSIHHTLDGERVHMGGDFIFCDRHESDALMLRAIRAVVRQYRHSLEENRVCDGKSVVELLDAGRSDKILEAFNAGELWKVTISGGWSPEHSLQTLIRQEAGRRVPAEYAQAKDSPTLARVKVIGSDGYGQSGVPALDGVEGKGYPESEREPGGIVEQQGQMRGLAKYGDPFQSLRLIVNNDRSVH